MLSNSIANGFNKATATAGGDLSANLLQMIAASIGLVSILTQFQQVFVFIKWAGVAYLACIGLKLIFTHARTRFGEQGC
ncbi:MAG: homoserine/homoserine lactone efflux protein [Parvicella sp.]|jgi:homoserine/homoserine lactone efflux protein